ncbi:MAG: YheC/YheD family protein [Candidatus Omnitrophota bacterium]
MKKTLLVIGDLMMSQVRNEPSLACFLSQKARLNSRKIGFVLITYDDLLNNRLPNIIAKRLKVMLFFPYNNWNANIERYDKDKRIYGDMRFGNDHKRIFQKVSNILERRYKDKEISFVNAPQACALDRDKLLTDRLLRGAGILTPHLYKIRSISQLSKLIEEGKAIYIKPRFGAMGKGITYLNRSGCYTNFMFKNGAIISHAYDYNWKTRQIPKDKQDAFLSILIKKGFIFQEAVESPIVNNRRFDIRVYVVGGNVPYLYAKSAPRKSFITNWSQGGRIEKGKNFLKRALAKGDLDKIKAIAKRGAKAVNLSFAGVDVIVDKNKKKIHLLEIQSFPGYERGFDLMRYLADTI